jgi:hypothetical protein
MYELNLLRNSRKLSATELEVAKAICEEMRRDVMGRPQYLQVRNADAEFALPDANWSYDAPNDFVKLFRRIVEAEPLDIQWLRGFTQVFSGYNLFGVGDGKSLRAAEMQFDDGFELRLAERLVEYNERFVHEHKALIQGLPQEFIFRPPSMLGEIGHMVDGTLVNSDTNTYQERINLLYRSGLAQRIRETIERTGEARICEIGGGYGALCYWFKQAFPNASYTIIDLPESLLFSRLYISLTRPDIPKSFGLADAKFGVRFLPNYMAEELHESFDLIINTLSMSEMTEYQVRKYAALMTKAWLGTDGVFFEQNQDNRSMGLLCAMELFATEFPHHYPLNREDAGYRNGVPNIWSLKPLELTPVALPPQKPSSVELLEDLGEFNLVRAAGTYWLLHKRLGPTDPLKLEVRDYPPVIYAASTSADVKLKINYRD